eukprot:UN26733
MTGITTEQGIYDQYYERPNYCLQYLYLTFKRALVNIVYWGPIVSGIVTIITLAILLFFLLMLIGISGVSQTWNKSKLDRTACDR